MTSFIELAKKRVSVRSYADRPMPDEDVVKILEAGRLAPSGNNAQPWRFIVVRDAAIKKKLYEVSGKQQWIIDAPVVIAVIADPLAKFKDVERNEYDSLNAARKTTLLIKAVRDASIAAEHIVLAATDLGYGSCWVALFEQEEIGPVLAVPEHCYVVTLLTVGRPKETPKPGSKRHSLAELTFDERYGRRTSICRE